MPQCRGSRTRSPPCASPSPPWSRPSGSPPPPPRCRSIPPRPTSAGTSPPSRGLRARDLAVLDPRPGLPRPAPGPGAPRGAPALRPPGPARRLHRREPPRRPPRGLLRSRGEPAVAPRRRRTDHLHHRELDQDRLLGRPGGHRLAPGWMRGRGRPPLHPPGHAPSTGGPDREEPPRCHPVVRARLPERLPRGLRDGCGGPRRGARGRGRRGSRGRVPGAGLRARQRPGLWKPRRGHLSGLGDPGRPRAGRPTSTPSPAREAWRRPATTSASPT